MTLSAKPGGVAPSKPRKAGIKSGCKTCRIRKVRCDKSWPACLRCLSTDRICDGYGIWGGGGDLVTARINYDARSDTATTQSEQGSPCAALKVYDLTSDENIYVEWYVNCTARKLPGLFPGGFWDKAMLQASSTEPAALKALLTLSSAHMKEAQGGGESEEAFILVHYNLALKLLRERISSYDESATELILLVCIAFIQLECTRENLQAATLHLKHGLVLINQLKSAAPNDWIVRTMRSYFLQAKLIGLKIESRWPSRLIPNLGQRFATPLDARHDMERLLLPLLSLEDENDVAEANIHIERVQSEVTGWHDKYLAVDQAAYDLAGRFAFQLLYAHWVLAKVMLAYYAGGEHALDKETRQFEMIVRESIELFKTAFSPAMQTLLVRKGMEKSHSIADIGWIVPLFYTAVKCKVHRLRVQAIRLFGCVDHREGLCPAGLLAIVAKQVQHLEEQDTFHRERDDFPLLSLPSDAELSQTKSATKQRIHEFSVEFPESPTGRLLLSCVGSDDSGRRSVWSGWYDLVSKRWTDSVHVQQNIAGAVEVSWASALNTVP